MNIIKNLKSLILIFNEFISDLIIKSHYQIIDIYECKETGFTKAIINLGGRHSIEKTIGDIVTDMTLLDGFDKKTIRTLTYMATVERFKPDYSVVVQQLGYEIDDYILEIRSRSRLETSKKSPSEVSKNKEMISKFSPIDANRIGYLAGIKETVKEFQMQSQKMD